MSCCPEQARIRIETPSGFQDLPIVDGVITVPTLAEESNFNAIGGCGITIIDNGPNGHEPVFSLNINPDSPIPITCDAAGRVSVGPAPSSPNWTSPNVTPTGGVRVIAGGTQGHAPTFALHIDPNSPIPVQVGPDGISVGPGSDEFSCALLGSCSINALADVSLNGEGIAVVDEVGQLTSTTFGATDGQGLVFDASTNTFVGVDVISTHEALGGSTANEGDVLRYDSTSGEYVPVDACELLSECLGAPGVTIPPAPTTGSAATLVFDPATSTFTWMQ